MMAYALYRLPHADRYTRVEGVAQELSVCAQLDDASGFVVAPFEVTASQPIVVICPDVVEECGLEEAYRSYESYGSYRTYGSYKSYGSYDSYAIDFANFHAQLLQGTFRKIVLARCADEPVVSPIDPRELFLRACQLYPRMFIALVYTPQSGLWLTATPEILLEGEAGKWRTIALAGTMQLHDDQLNGEGETVTWSTKNIEEQRIVATYIAECLEQFTNDFTEEGPRTVRAANLVHLRSDFTFTLPDEHHLGSLLGQLHPTPAVCGLPKREAFRFIVRNEHTPRRYYSGFMGPLNIPSPITLHPSPFTLHPSPQSTHLYVSLRCMNIETDCYHLYAGGGLLKDSQLDLEWAETEAKLQTMRRLISSCRHNVISS